MNPTVWIAANTLSYPEGGGHFWVFLNWALGLRSLGCRVVWLEAADPSIAPDQLHAQVAALTQRLARYGLAQSLALCSASDQHLPKAIVDGCIDLDQARDADLLLNLSYDASPGTADSFRRSAFVDI